MILREVFMDVIALHRQGYSIRAIARKLGIHRATVKKHLEDPSFPKYERRTERGSILEPYGQVIKSFLEEDHYQATWIFERLKKLGYNGSYDTVKLYVKGIKEQQSRLAYVRFETEPGLQAQVDWGDFKIEEPDGTLSTVHAFCMVLSILAGSLCGVYGALYPGSFPGRAHPCLSLPARDPCRDSLR